MPNEIDVNIDLNTLKGYSSELVPEAMKPLEITLLELALSSSKNNTIEEKSCFEVTHCNKTYQVTLQNRLIKRRPKKSKGYPSKGNTGVRWHVIAEELGQGSFAHVFDSKTSIKIENKKITGVTPRLRKVVKLFSDGNAEINRKNEALEIDAYHKAKIHKVHGSCSSTQPLNHRHALILPKIPGKDICESLVSGVFESDSYNALEYNQKVIAAYIIAHAYYRQFHQKRLVHYDAKPHNTMIDINRFGVVSAKIIDLGFVRTQGTNNPGTFNCTVEYSAPEIYDCNYVDGNAIFTHTADPRVDSYGISSCMAIMLGCSDDPLELTEKDGLEIQKHIKEGKYHDAKSALIKGRTLNLGGITRSGDARKDNLIKKLLQDMCNEKSEERSTAKDAMDVIATQVLCKKDIIPAWEALKTTVDSKADGIKKKLQNYDTWQDYSAIKKLKETQNALEDIQKKISEEIASLNRAQNEAAGDSLYFYAEKLHEANDHLNAANQYCETISSNINFMKSRFNSMVDNYLDEMKPLHGKTTWYQLSEQKLKQLLFTTKYISPQMLENRLNEFNRINYKAILLKNFNKSLENFIHELSEIEAKALYVLKNRLPNSHEPLTGELVMVDWFNTTKESFNNLKIEGTSEMVGLDEIKEKIAEFKALQAKSVKEIKEKLIPLAKKISFFQYIVDKICVLFNIQAGVTAKPTNAYREQCRIFGKNASKLTSDAATCVKTRSHVQHS